jgi:hypothetical protein
MEYRNSPRPAGIFGITSYLSRIVVQALIALPVAAQTPKWGLRSKLHFQQGKIQCFQHRRRIFFRVID